MEETRAVHGAVSREFCGQVLEKLTARETEAEFLDDVQALMQQNLDCEELAAGIYDCLISQEALEDRVRVAAGQEYARFGAFVARRCGERMALLKFLTGLRIALRLK